MAVWVLPVAGKLQLERRRLERAGSRQRPAEQRSAHRTGRTGSTDEVPTAEDPVDHIIIAVCANIFDGVLHEFGARALEEPGVELEASDGVLYARHREARAPKVKMKPPESEEAVGIGAGFELQIRHDLRRDPARAQFVPRKAFLVEHEHFRAGSFQALRRRGAGGTAANHDDLDASHGAPTLCTYNRALAESR